MTMQAEMRSNLSAYQQPLNLVFVVIDPAEYDADPEVFASWDKAVAWRDEHCKHGNIFQTRLRYEMNG